MGPLRSWRQPQLLGRPQQASVVLGVRAGRRRADGWVGGGRGWGEGGCSTCARSTFSAAGPTGGAVAAAFARPAKDAAWGLSQHPSPGAVRIGGTVGGSGSPRRQLHHELAVEDRGFWRRPLPQPLSQACHVLVKALQPGG
jgi:hypothetical protein